MLTTTSLSPFYLTILTVLQATWLAVHYSFSLFRPCFHFLSPYPLQSLCLLLLDHLDQVPGLSEHLETYQSITQYYLFLCSWAGSILKILQPNWLWEQAEFSYPWTQSGWLKSAGNLEVKSLYPDTLQGNVRYFVLKWNFLLTERGKMNEKKSGME